LLYPESETKLNADNFIGDNGFYNIVAAVRFIQYVIMNEPIDVCTLRLFIENRVNNLMLNFLGLFALVRYTR